MHGQPLMSIAWLRDPFNPVRNKNGDAMRIEIDPADLLPLIEQVVSETIARLEADDANLGSRLGYTEAEAAVALFTSDRIQPLAWIEAWLDERDSSATDRN